MTLSQSSKLNDLYELSNSLGVLHDHSVCMAADNGVGEPFHPDYQTNKERFSKLLRSQRSIELAMQRYLKGLSERAILLVDWSEYDRRKGSDLLDQGMGDEQQQLDQILNDLLIDVVVLGGQSLEEELSISIGLSKSSLPAIKFVDQYTLELSKQLTKTSEKVLRQSIKKSIELGENQTQAAARLNNILNDQKRAEKIAHTETVRAYGEGRMVVGENIGARWKSWDTTFNPCPICILNGEAGIVPFDHLWQGTYRTIPAHPYCKCLVRIYLYHPDGRDENKKPAIVNASDRNLRRYLVNSTLSIYA